MCLFAVFYHSGGVWATQGRFIKDVRHFVGRRLDRIADVACCGFQGDKGDTGATGAAGPPGAAVSSTHTLSVGTGIRGVTIKAHNSLQTHNSAKVGRMLVNILHTEAAASLTTIMHGSHPCKGQ